VKIRLFWTEVPSSSFPIAQIPLIKKKKKKLRGQKIKVLNHMR